MWQHEWPVPENVGLAFTDRFNGVSRAPFSSLNVGTHVGDDINLVAQNRQLLVKQLALPAEPIWLEQVHSTIVLNNPQPKTLPFTADGSYTNQAHIVCTVMTADCLPVVICNKAGTEVAAVHAGWRGLCHGIIEQALQMFNASPSQLMAYLGPAIGPQQFEVGAEVRQAFIDKQPQAQVCFRPVTASNHTSFNHSLESSPSLLPQKYLANIYQLAQQRLTAMGVNDIYSSDECTVSNLDFFSYRREQQTGRQATLVWLKS
ncbi:peptidoglycan editing factor PgeF [Shewanella intestini]|uniref:Purine nucleoside phosphorylase n=1 Tax=Shewanella intestini TaxID=2017544 RepID=A0ABS5I5X6_9GAMM|nr:MULTISPECIES: peptidoglycan editing factor PgeF [Shewanella]MBR9729429.1 peptidoglycan editing factor PgeF [Shewanella intestini]MRG37509.1 peptidoglycan editing factor PgeF [Shewanella sp. XMDDZSB0408]